jgi:hypothetical protein
MEVKLLIQHMLWVLHGVKRSDSRSDSFTLGKVLVVVKVRVTMEPAAYKISLIGRGWTFTENRDVNVRGNGRTARKPNVSFSKHCQPLIEWVPGALSLGLKQPGREADHSPPSSAEVKNAWRYTSTPPIRFHVVLPACYPMGTRGSFRGVKRPGREGDHSHLVPKSRNAWSFTSIPPIRLHGVVLG